MGIKFTNNAITTLAATLAIGGSSMTVVTGGGANFLSDFSGSGYQLVVITDGTNTETVKVTARSGDVFTVIRAYEGSAREWLGGAKVVGAFTARAFDDALNSSVTASTVAGEAAASKILGTSTTTLNLSTIVLNDTISVTVADSTARTWIAGNSLAVVNTADAAKYLVADILSYVHPTISAKVIKKVGTGSLSSWNLNIAGAAGIDGVAATIAVGTVTPLSATAAPTIVNSGTTAAAVFDFGIPAGAAGAAATIAVGTVTPLSATAAPTIVNSGTTAAAVFDFGIPAGTAGAAGAAATIAVGTVTPLSATAAPTIVNSGTTAAAVFDFGIPAGTAGPAGAAATISVGTVTPLASGAQPTIVNAGTTAAAVFNFGIPAGADGDITWQGAWSGATTYAVNEAVSYGGSSWVSIQAGNLNHTPADDTWWDPLALKGDTGATGAAGTNGTNAVADHSVLSNLTADDHAQYAKTNPSAISVTYTASGTTTVTLNGRNELFYATAATGATTWSFAGAATSGTTSGFTLELTNGGLFTQTWPAAVKWDSGTAPTLTSSGIDILVFYTRDAGTTWRGFMAAKDSK